ncbi:hypothetical protein I8751_24655 [Nostocaceae cyanobacterium CENA357]|uniref:Uncharacterized protein n=1 Tax=Atlanticothrix silvestris CENA357 TaxID=1725252 RepID=A0A8J7HIM3_9CYAN|nr:hypothetical protein [Atlanticothrix silvestris]MBH8555478.1 hypothetical protein [Atlanticothrix silvestris CENA357]
MTRWLQKYRQQGLLGLLEIKKPLGQIPTNSNNQRRSTEITQSEIKLT